MLCMKCYGHMSMTLKSVVKSEMTKKISIRFDDDLFKKIEAEIQTSGKSQTEVIHLLVEQGLKYDKDAKDVQRMKEIITKYDGRCIKCGENIPAQSSALWGKGIGLLCMDCYIKRIGDKAVVRKVMKLKELNWQIQAFKKILDELAEKYRLFNLYELIDRLSKGDEELNKKNWEFLREKIGTEDERKTIETIVHKVQQQRKIMDEIYQFMQIPFKKKKKRKKKSYEV